jgi:hypothetical protein
MVFCTQMAGGKWTETCGWPPVVSGGQEKW